MGRFLDMRLESICGMMTSVYIVWTNCCAQEEVHGHVEETIKAGDGHEDGIGSQDYCVQYEKNHKEGDLVFMEPGESQENELCHICEVLSLHSLISVSENNVVNMEQFPSGHGL